VGQEGPVLGLIGYSLGAVPFVILYASLRFTIEPVWDARFQRFMKWPGSLRNMFGIVLGTFGDQIAIYITIVMAAHAYHYYGMIRREELEKADLQEAPSESELQALMTQLHPHFLFNTLLGISTLIETDRGLARLMVLRLSELLRITLEHGATDLAPLETEVEFVRGYLDMEKMRKDQVAAAKNGLPDNVI
jgi:hypothetical protein